MGKNLWQLLLAPPARPPITREISSKDSPQKPALSLTPDVVPAADEAKDLPPLGHFSHNTAYGYLASAAGAEHMRNWRLQSPVKVIEKVKAMLLAERTGAEWEILEGNEWEEEEEAQADVRDVGGRGPGLGVEETGVLVPGGVRGGEGREEGKGTSGWMKLRSR